MLENIDQRIYLYSTECMAEIDSNLKIYICLRHININKFISKHSDYTEKLM